MSDYSNTTPVGVSNTPINMAAATSLAAFIAITKVLSAMIEADEDAGPFGEPALSGLCDEAADAEARCRTSVSDFLARTQIDPVLHAAAVQIDGILNDMGTAPDMLVHYLHAVARLASLCTLRAAMNARRGVIDLHNTRCSDALHHTAMLLGRMVESAIALTCVTIQDDPHLSIPEMLSV